MSFLTGKTVLITGGTGYLGRALTSEILKHKPASIRVFSRDEFKHHLIQEKFKEHWDVVKSLVGDVRDYERVERAMKGCDIVIHAAALKRIDMIEYNVEESIKTNIIGTMNIVRAALKNNVEKAVFVSTDKACSPVNTYGACKFVSERIFIESNFSKGKARTAFSCVRYGNVANSTGSMIPFFLDQINNNKEITLTDPKMTRFLITDRQAVDLVLKAIEYGEGGEVFVPRIPAFRIVDLIKHLKEKNGSNAKIKIIGLRPGEKIHEQMVNFSESPRTYEFKGAYVILSQIQKYQEKVHYKYLKGSKKVDFNEYNSENSLLEGEQLKRYLNKIGI